MGGGVGHWSALLGRAAAASGWRFDDDWEYLLEREQKQQEGLRGKSPFFQLSVPLWL